MTSVSRDTVQIPEQGPAGDRRVDAAQLLDTLGEVVFQTDAEGRWTYLNRAWERLTGFETGPSLGTRFLDYVHPDELEYTITLFMGVVAGGADHCHHETRYRTRDGSYRRVQIRAMVIRDETGAVVGNTGTILDVTASRHGTETIGEHAALLELVPAQVGGGDLPVGVAVYGADLRLRRTSPVIDRIAGAPQRLGAPLSDLVDLLWPADPRQRPLGGEWGMVPTALRTNHAQTGDLDVTVGRGPVMSLRVSVIPSLQDGEEVLAVVLTDITDLRRAENRQAGLARLGSHAVSGSGVDALVAEAIRLITSVLDGTRCELVRPDGHIPDGEPTIVTARIGGVWSPFGFLAVWPPAARLLGADEKTFVQAVAHVLTAALERDRAEHELRGLYERAERGKAWLAASAQMTAGVLTAPGMPAAFDTVVAMARQMAAVDLAAIAVPDEHGNLVLTAADVASDLPVRPDALRGLAIGLAGSQIRDELARSRTVLLDCLDLRGSRVLPAPDVPFATALIVPMRLTDQSPAVLILGNRAESTRRPPGDVELVQAFANDAALAVELVRAQQERARLAVFKDRDRIARDLHDQVIQRLFAIGLQLQSLVRLIGDLAAARLTAATSALDQTIEEIRRTIFALQPS
ncbi:PAS domain-containing protein [Parafrankia sp. FMc2]|uniref:PAS domain-containing protein n=1 Tax=Parafrankia sp. FMc2 TaxID=3233196 RepID=UPI003B587875